jgi:hypothetical protein
MLASRLVGLGVAIACAGSSLAHADNKALKAAQANLPDMPLAVVVDVQALGKSAIWAKVVPTLLARQDVKDAVATIKTSCNIDVPTAVTSLVLAEDPAKDNAVAAYLAIPSVGKAKALSCLQQVAADRSKTATDPKDKFTITSKTDGNLVQIDDGHETIFVGFIGDVLVLPSPQVWNDKDATKAWLSGGGAFAKGGVGKLLAKAPADATLAGASNSAGLLADAVGKSKAAYVWSTIASGKVGGELHVDVGDATAAQTATDTAAKDLADRLANPELPALKAVYAGLSVVRVGTEMVVKASLAESDVANLIALAQLAFMTGH